jgi:hypothetical protein
MSKASGRSIAVSPFRRLVIDLMHFSQQVPAVTIDRRMDLSELIAARKVCMPKPTWTAMFMKAYAIVALHQPLLRTSYMKFPWPRFYEHPRNIACANFSQKHLGEDIVLQTQIRCPENRSLREIDAIVQQLKDAPVAQCDAFRRVMKLASWPMPIRRFIIWATLNVFGRRRAHNLGTYGITSVADKGAGVLNLVPLLTSTLHYGLFDPDGCINVRLAFDHRVIDGAPAAEALAHLERTLLGEILEEVHSLGTFHAKPRLAA